MTLFMDHHKDVEGLSAEAVAEAHRKDLEIQDEYGVKYQRDGDGRRPGRQHLRVLGAQGAVGRE